MSIFISIKRLFQHSAVYGLGHIFNRLIVFFLLPLYTNTFSQALYGVYTIVFAYIAIIGIIYSYGLDTAFFRFYILDDSQQSRNKIFSTAFITIFITSIFFSSLIFFARRTLAFYIFSESIHELPVNLEYIVGLTAGILLFDSLMLMPFLILRAEEKPFQFIFFKFLNVVINLVFNIIFIVYLKMGVEGIFIANIVSSAGTLLLMIPIVLKHFQFIFSLPTFKELFAFGIPYLPSTMSVNLMDTIDKIILEKLQSVDDVGVYGANSKLGMFMALFITAFRFAWHPFFLSTSKQDNAKQVFTKVFTYVLFACSFVFLFFSLFIDDIVRIRIAGITLLEKNYWDGTIVVPIIFLAYICYAAYLNFLIGIYLEKKTKYLPFITGAGIIGNVIALYTLIPVWGYVGAAWARVIAYMIMAVLLYFVGQRLYSVSYEWLKVLKLIFTVAVLFFIGRSVIFQPSIILKVLLFVSFPFVLWIIRFYNREELVTMSGLLKKHPKKKLIDG